MSPIWLPKRYGMFGIKIVAIKTLSLYSTVLFLNYLTLIIVLDQLSFLMVGLQVFEKRKKFEWHNLQVSGERRY